MWGAGNDGVISINIWPNMVSAAAGVHLCRLRNPSCSLIASLLAMTETFEAEVKSF